MLPPKDLHEKCLRCGQALQAEQRICETCGADRDIEMKIAAELHPALASLRRWLVAVGAVFAVVGIITYSHYGSALPIVDLALPFAIAGVLFLLAVLAPAIPLTASVVAMGLFLAHWGLAAIQSPWAAVEPSVWLVVRVMILVSLADGVRAGYKAYSLRRRAAGDFPRARARVKKA